MSVTARISATPAIENFAWEPRRGTPFTVLDRHTGEVVGRCEADPFFAFHHVNACERGNELVLDIVAYPDADIVTHYYLQRLTGTDLRLPHGRLTRYTVPLNGGRRSRVRAEVLSDTCIELPHIDYAHHNMDPEQHCAYGIGRRPERDHEFYNQLVKIDTAGRTTVTWHEPDCFPGLLAVPIGWALAGPLARRMGQAMLETDLDVAFAWWAVGAWLAVVLTIAALATVLPARQAARTSVRESLAYG